MSNYSPDRRDGQINEHLAAAVAISASDHALAIPMARSSSHGTMFPIPDSSGSAIAASRGVARRSRVQSLVIGAAGEPAVARVVAELRLLSTLDPLTILLPSHSESDAWQRDLPKVASDICSTVRSIGNAEICVVSTGLAGAKLNDLYATLRVLPCTVRVIPDAQVEHFLQFPRRDVGRFCAVEIQKTSMTARQRFLKRALDLVVSIPLLIFLLPLLCAIALLVRLDSPGTALFKQTRLGYRGKPFSIFKFRSMTVKENGDEVRQAQAGDQRVTRIGRILRKTSLDELPQLFNVIRGEMSLVGPRPHALAHDKHFGALVERYEIRQLVKPGITGWAQVNGFRGETATLDSMHHRVEYDLHYARNANLWLDLKILLMTVRTVLSQQNAY